MPGDTDVKDSSTNGVKDNGSPTVEQLLANAKAENERKQTEIQSLRSEKQSVADELAELREVKKQYGVLTARQEAQKRQLLGEQETIDSQINTLKQKPEAQAWFEQQRRELEKTAKETKESAKMEALTELAVDFLMDKAEELAEKEEFKDLDHKTLFKKIKPFLTDYQEETPYRRTKLAFRDWLKSVENKAKDAERSKKEAEEAASRENNGRNARDNNASVDDLIKSGNRATAREKLGIMTRPK